ACDVNPLPLEGATVNFYDNLGALVASATTLADGSYTWALEAGTYNIEVIAAGYIDQMVEDVVLEALATVTTDFDLRLDAPCLSVDPTSLEQSLMPNTTGTQTLTLVNTGAGDAAFELMEMPVVKGVNAEQIILDPSFELYTDPSSPWAQYSANFGTPLCTADDCGTGTGTGPHTGDVWSWFGGSSTGDSGYVSQSVAMDPGSATLTFWVEQYVCGANGAANYTALLVDGTEIWRTDGTDAACGVLGYRQITLDMSDYADGSTHEIKFNSVTTDGANFFIDDVELNLEAGGDVTWLSEDPTAGTVAADSTLAVTVTFDATGLALGDYFAELRVKQAPYATINVPVTLHVVESLTRYIHLPLIMK
ncbi:MAG TPA: carboxypeptidase-like regulatory domain-containing protein, partial [Anaerolineaceae bacterium]|nr:carboxypeptidase-like regulatory domain-containing protein [Anaerolineaceae bacterium]